MATKTTKAAADSAAQADVTASAEIIAPTAQETTEIAANSESGADSDVVAPTPSDGDEIATLSETVEVVVRPKRTVKHEGKTHGATALVTLPRDDAERLKAIGFVDYLDDLHEAAQASQGVKVSVSGGVAFKQE